jgi:hypothetical protein
MNAAPQSNKIISRILGILPKAGNPPKTHFAGKIAAPRTNSLGVETLRLIKWFPTVPNQQKKLVDSIRQHFDNAAKLASRS